MMNILPIYKVTQERGIKGRESERELLIRVARERQIEDRRERRRSVVRRITGRGRRAA
jgi:hypothetical protein